MKKQKNHSKIYKIDGVGIDLKRFIPRDEISKLELKKELNFDNNAFIILNVAEINHNKNQIMLLRCVPELLKTIPNLRILFAGGLYLFGIARWMQKKYTLTVKDGCILLSYIITSLILHDMLIGPRFFAFFCFMSIPIRETGKKFRHFAF